MSNNTYRFRNTERRQEVHVITPDNEIHSIECKEIDYRGRSKYYTEWPDGTRIESSVTGFNLATALAYHDDRRNN